MYTFGFSFIVKNDVISSDHLSNYIINLVNQVDVENEFFGKKKVW